MIGLNTILNLPSDTASKPKTTPNTDPKLSPSPSLGQEIKQEAQSKEILAGVERIMAKVLDDLASKSTLNLSSTLKQSGLLSDANSAIKALASELSSQDSPSLQNLFIKLKEFTRPILDISASTLQTSIQNSGIGLEAKLANALLSHSLPPEINRLFSDIKHLSNNEIFTQILSLASQDLDENASFLKLESIISSALNDATKLASGSALARFLSLPDKLENIVKYLSRSNPKDADMAKQELAHISKALSQSRAAIEQMSSYKSATSHYFLANKAAFNQLADQIELELAPFEKIGSKSEFLSSFLKLNQQEYGIGDKLKIAAKRLFAMLEVSDGKALNARRDILELRSLVKSQKIAATAIDKIKQNSPKDIAAIAQNDLKALLLSASDEIKSSQNEALKAAAQKLLASIEANQILSSLTGELSSLLPYSWDDLDSARVSFKRGKKQKFHAQVELSFKYLGSFNAIISLSDKRHIDISAAVQKDELRVLINRHKAQLKDMLFSSGLILGYFGVKMMPKRFAKDELFSFHSIELGLDKRA